MAWETDLIEGTQAPAPPPSEYQLVTDTGDVFITDLFETIVAVVDTYITPGEPSISSSGGELSIGDILTITANAQPGVPTGTFELYRNGVNAGAVVDGYVLVDADMVDELTVRSTNLYSTSADSNALSYRFAAISAAKLILNRKGQNYTDGGNLDTWTNEASSYPWTLLSSPGISGAGGFTVRRDGNALVSWYGELYSLGGWSADGSFPGAAITTNQILKLNTSTRTWDEVLAHEQAPAHTGAGARWRPRHMLQSGVTTHTDGVGTLWLYVLAGDHYDPTYSTEVWRTSDPLMKEWEYLGLSSAGPLFLQGCSSVAGNLYVFGGQTDITDPLTATNVIRKSIDSGQTWVTIAAVLPEAKGAMGVTTLGSLTYILGGGTYAAAAASRTYYNDVHSFDGTTVTSVLASGHGQWPLCQYLSASNDGTRMFLSFGYGLPANGDAQGIGQVKVSTDLGVTWADAGDFLWNSSHAVGACFHVDSIVHMGGHHAGANTFGYQTWAVRSTPGNASPFSYLLASGATAPTMGATINGQSAPTSSLAAPTIMSPGVAGTGERRDLFTTELHGFLVFYASAVTSNDPFATSNEAIISDGAGTVWSISLRNNAGTYQIQQYIYDGANKQIVNTFALTTDTLVEFGLYGGSLRLRVGAAAAAAPVACGVPFGDGSPAVRLFRNFGAESPDCRLACLVICNAQMSAGELADARAYCANTYGVSA